MIYTQIVSDKLDSNRLKDMMNLIDELDKPLLVQCETSSKARAVCLCVMHLAERWKLDDGEVSLKLRQMGIDAEGSSLIQQFFRCRMKP